MQVAPAGDRALLVELGEVTAKELHAAAARALTLSGVVRCTPGHSSLYVVFSGAPDADAVRGALAEVAADAGAGESRRVHEVPVAFDGEDLREFLAQTECALESFLARVDGLRLVARYLGFRGGFAYLDGWPEEWAMPRRKTSRPVARGAFAIAGAVAAFYPIDSPGGWNVLGHTGLDLENVIAAGDELVLRPVAYVAATMRPRTAAGPAPPRAIEIVSAPLAIWTDRPFDAMAAAIANHAVGNDATAPLFECPLAGPQLRFKEARSLAWCAPDLSVRVEWMPAGGLWAFGRVTGGLRGYLAIGEREGVVARVVRDDRHVIRMMPGPHDIGVRDLECEVTPHLDRIGIRLRPLTPLGVDAIENAPHATANAWPTNAAGRAGPADLPSVGMQTGTVQLHPDGSLVAMGPDHPVTGGYLQPMTVLSAECWKLAQLAPGDRVRFVTGMPASPPAVTGSVE